MKNAYRIILCFFLVIEALNPVSLPYDEFLVHELKRCPPLFKELLHDVSSTLGYENSFYKIH